MPYDLPLSCHNLSMAETLKARAGSSLKARFSYLQPDKTPVDTTGSTARIAIKAIKPSSRVIVESEESVTANSVLELLEPGRWRLYLSGAVTKILPPTVAWELELVSNADPDDVTSLASGVILTEPEGVKNFE